MTPEEIIKQLGLQPEPDFNGCEACRIEHKDLHVKQMPRHTCGIDGPNPDLDKRKTSSHTPDDPNAAYNEKVLEIAEELAKIEYEERSTAFCYELTWDGLDQHAQEVSISSQMRAARAMVEKMSKIAKASHEAGWIHRSICKHTNKEIIATYFNAIASQSGLIPSTKNDDNAG